MWLGTVTCNPSLRRQRSGGSQFETSPGKKFATPPSQPISQLWWHTPVVPAIWETIGRWIKTQANHSKKERVYLK
jgi:hypothetical protein